MSSRAILTSFVMLALGAVISLGCDSSTPSSRGGSSMEELASAVDAQKAAQQQEQARLEAEQKAEAAAAQNQAPAENRTVAGRSGVGEGGYYTAIVGARRHVLNRVDDLAWLQGVQHFQAEHGRLPKDHEEFMARIVQPLGIDLGYKEEDQEFLYDPSEGQWGQVYVVEKQVEPVQP